MRKPFGHCVDYGLRSGHEPQFGRLAEEPQSIEIPEDICNVQRFIIWSNHPDRIVIQEFQGN